MERAVQIPGHCVSTASSMGQLITFLKRYTTQVQVQHTFSYSIVGVIDTWWKYFISYNINRNTYQKIYAYNYPYCTYSTALQSTTMNKRQRNPNPRYPRRPRHPRKSTSQIQFHLKTYYYPPPPISFFSSLLFLLFELVNFIYPTQVKNRSTL